MGLVAILSKLMQKRTSTYLQMHQAVGSTMVALKSLLEHDGPHTTLGRQQIPNEPPACGVTDFCGREIKDTASERAKFVATANDFIEGVVNRLEMPYPQNTMIDGFASLDPRSITSTGERDETFFKLVEHFGKPKVSSDGEFHVGPIQQPACLLQWETLKSILSDNQHMTMGEFYREFVHTHPDVHIN